MQESNLKSHSQLTKLPSYKIAWLVLALLTLVYVFNIMNRFIMSIFIPQISEALSINNVQIGILYGTAFVVFYALFGICLSKLADVWNRKLVILFSLITWSIMAALCGLAGSFAQFALFRAGVGLGEAGSAPAANSLLSDYFPKEKRGTALSVFSAGIYIGAGLCILFGGLIFKYWQPGSSGMMPLGLDGWQAALIIVGLGGLILVPALLFVKELPRGISEGLHTPPHPHPWRAFWEEFEAIIPPFTLWHAIKLGRSTFRTNLLLILISVVLWRVLVVYTGDLIQWSVLMIGIYALASWSLFIKQRDPEMFGMMWGNRAFVMLFFGFGFAAATGYAISGFVFAYVETAYGVSKAAAGASLGVLSAIVGASAVISGGVIGDRLRRNFETGRIWFVFCSLAVALPFGVLSLRMERYDLFLLLNLTAHFFISTWAGVIAATTQDMVLPRMRGAVIAIYIAGTAVIGLGTGPYLVGKVADLLKNNGASDVLALREGLTYGYMFILFALVFIWFLARFLPAAEAKLQELQKATE